MTNETLLHQTAGTPISKCAILMVRLETAFLEVPDEAPKGDTATGVRVVPH